MSEPDLRFANIDRTVRHDDGAGGVFVRSVIAAWIAAGETPRAAV